MLYKGKIFPAEERKRKKEKPKPSYMNYLKKKICKQEKNQSMKNTIHAFK